MAQVFLSLGSNLGDRFFNLENALDQIQEVAGEIVRRSSVYETEPWGEYEQPDFLNMAVVIDTRLDPYELLGKLKRIEKKLLRMDTKRWRERLIDIDILFYESKIILTDELVVPHPCLQDRMFVLKPLMELNADFVHPVFGKTISELVKKCMDPLKVEPVILTYKRLNV